MRTSCATVGPQPHLDPLLVVVPHRDVREPIRHEVSVERTVDHGEHVAIERGGDSGSVVVGRDESLAVLDQVGAEQQVLALGQAAGQVARGTLPARMAPRLPMVPAEEGDEARAGVIPARQQ